MKHTRTFETFELDGHKCKINVCVNGQGPQTLIFVHGLTSSEDVWNGVIPIFSKDYTCISLDLPGHGESDGLLNYNMETFVAIITQLIERKAADQKVCLIGHSMGGLICMVVAARYPKLVSNLVLLAPAGMEQFNHAEGKLLVRLATGAAMQTNIFTRMFLDMKNSMKQGNKPEPAIWDGLLDTYQNRLKPTDPRVLKECIAAMVSFPAHDYLHGISQPTLLFFGLSDPLIPNRMLHGRNTRKVAEEGAAAIRNCKLVLLDNCGHYIQRDMPGTFNSELKLFLEKNVTS